MIFIKYFLLFKCGCSSSSNHLNLHWKLHFSKIHHLGPSRDTKIVKFFLYSLSRYNSENSIRTQSFRSININMSLSSFSSLLSIYMIFIQHCSIHPLCHSYPPPLYFCCNSNIFIGLPSLSGFPLCFSSILYMVDKK